MFRIGLWVREEKHALLSCASLFPLYFSSYAAFDDLESRRHTIVSPALRTFASIERTFFRDGLRLADALPDIPDMVAAAPVAPFVPVRAAAVAAAVPVAVPVAAATASVPVVATAAVVVPAAASVTAATAGQSVLAASASASSRNLIFPANTVVRAKFAYAAGGADELSFSPGDRIKVGGESGRRHVGWPTGMLKITWGCGYNMPTLFFPL